MLWSKEECALALLDSPEELASSLSGVKTRELALLTLSPDDAVTSTRVRRALEQVFGGGEDAVGTQSGFWRS